MQENFGTNEVSDPVARQGKERFDALVFVHGFLDNRAVWQPLIDALAFSGIPSLAIELRGAGERRNDGRECTLAQSVRDIEQLIDDMQLMRIALVGHSMGAQVAELVAIERPEQVASLILVTPTPLGGNTLPDEVRALLRESGDDPVAQRGIRVTFSRNLTESQLDALVAPNVLMGKHAARQYYDAFSNGDPRGNLPCPYPGDTLIIAAQEDPVISHEMVGSIHRERFPRAHLRTIANSGHWPHLEQPEQTAKVISEHLGLSRK